MITEQLTEAAYQAAQTGLVGSIIHELNNRLTAVSLRIGSLLDQIPEGDPCKPKLRTIERDMERMGDLVHGVSQIALPTEGPLSLVDVREEVERILELVQFHLLARCLTVVEEFSPTLPSILADSQQLRRLLFHSFLHAIRESKQGGVMTVRQRVQKRSCLRGGEYLVTEIEGERQDGSPSSESVKSAVVTRKQSPEERSAVLALCRSIVKRHRGTLNVGIGCGRRGSMMTRIALPVSSC